VTAEHGNERKTEEGYSVWCPGLPGCCSQGLTETEALDNIKDADEPMIRITQPYLDENGRLHKKPKE
jgi:predicted RNase H-like HicB family nuclease